MLSSHRWPTAAASRRIARSSHAPRALPLDPRQLRSLRPAFWARPRPLRLASASGRRHLDRARRSRMACAARPRRWRSLPQGLNTRPISRRQSTAPRTICRRRA